MQVAVAVTVYWLFPLDPQWAATLELNAMLPIAGTVYVLAQGYQIGAERAASAVLLSTVLSMLTPACRSAKALLCAVI